MSHLLDKIDERIAATHPSHHEKANVKLLIEARDRLRQLEYESEQRRYWGLCSTKSRSEIRTAGGRE